MQPLSALFSTEQINQTLTLVFFFSILKLIKLIVINGLDFKNSNFISEIQISIGMTLNIIFLIQHRNFIHVKKSHINQISLKSFMCISAIIKNSLCSGINRSVTFILHSHIIISTITLSCL